MTRPFQLGNSLIQLPLTRTWSLATAWIKHKQNAQLALNTISVVGACSASAQILNTGIDRRLCLCWLAFQGDPAVLRPVESLFWARS